MLTRVFADMGSSVRTHWVLRMGEPKLSTTRRQLCCWPLIGCLVPCFLGDALALYKLQDPGSRHYAHLDSVLLLTIQYYPFLGLIYYIYIPSTFSSDHHTGGSTATHENIHLVWSYVQITKVSLITPASLQTTGSHRGQPPWLVHNGYTTGRDWHLQTSPIPMLKNWMEEVAYIKTHKVHEFSEDKLISAAASNPSLKWVITTPLVQLITQYGNTTPTSFNWGLRMWGQNADRPFQDPSSCCQNV